MTPIAIWNGVIVEGHGRLVAALELRMEEIPVIRLDDLTDEQRRAYALVHNKVTMDSGFDLDLLSLELEDLEGMDLDAFGFDIGELPDFTEAEPKEEKEKEPKTIICPHCGKTIEV